MGGSKTVQSNAPWGPAQPYILQNLQQQSDVLNSTQPDLENYAAMQRDTYGRVSPGAEQGITSAQNLVNQNLSGANLNGNPYLDAIIGQRNQDVINGVNDQFSEAGRYGSGSHAAILAKELANADDQLRYQNYSTERGYQQQAISDAQNLMGGSQSLLNNAAELPWIGVQAANGAVRQASGGYGTQTTTKSGGLGSTLGSLLGTGLQAASLFSDRRLKRDIERIGEMDDGLPIYRWNYVWGEPAQGVMADEVALFRPWALGPEIGGYATVNYGAL